MNRKLKPTKSTTQARDKQVALILEEFEKDIENFKIAIQNKDKQLADLEKILKAAKDEYKKLTKENEYLTEYILKFNSNNSNNKKKNRNLF